MNEQDAILKHVGHMGVGDGNDGKAYTRSKQETI